MMWVYTMEDFYNAWQYLDNHPYFTTSDGISVFEMCLDIFVTKVNPKTDEISRDSTKNTKIQVWLESGKFDEKENMFTHDIRLDCSGDSFEDAIINLAKLVKKHIGDK